MDNKEKEAQEFGNIIKEIIDKIKPLTIKHKEKSTEDFWLALINASIAIGTHMGISFSHQKQIANFIITTQEERQKGE